VASGSGTGFPGGAAKGRKSAHWHFSLVLGAFAFFALFFIWVPTLCFLLRLCKRESTDAHSAKKYFKMYLILALFKFHPFKER
jgi:hypothetical protein